ncbi:hypothetical protein BOTBODRAFT_62208 [Botryobasidium botryosum FD-172 SS1]|uniref:Uncharacterized protein n=1 Tax=Botryobasidium botryosum (strain FD-172 SS1) TaxID=930990 RepID=A0A067MW14_BOTB1|nr:hypothetical protein BOTBODRAFT_62208 [Botryobasidium botryosum FD-172 SS1]
MTLPPKTTPGPPTADRAGTTAPTILVTAVRQPRHSHRVHPYASPHAPAPSSPSPPAINSDTQQPFSSARSATPVGRRRGSTSMATRSYSRTPGRGSLSATSEVATPSPPTDGLASQIAAIQAAREREINQSALTGDREGLPEYLSSLIPSDSAAVSSEPPQCLSIPDTDAHEASSSSSPPLTNSSYRLQSSSPSVSSPLRNVVAIADSEMTAEHQTALRRDIASRISISRAGRNASHSPPVSEVDECACCGESLEDP